MDTEFYNQLQTVPSSLSTTTDISQEFSPPKLKHQDSTSLPYSYNSSQVSIKIFAKNNDGESFKSSRKPIFKIIREAKVSHSSTVPLNKDFGNYNRKEKSLGELSKRLLIMFGRIDQCVISLDTVTQQLGVERRRIYDIINILESLGVVYRKGKNSYQWKGLKSIHETIKKLQRENLIRFDDKSTQDDADSEDEDGQELKSGLKREKSLGLLSTGFIKLFLSWKGTISLEQAGRKLSSENIEENKIKTKIRRLYDIANVFSSLGLIKKTCLESKKPAYEWVGLPGLDAFIKRLNTSSDEREIFQESSSKHHKDKVSPVPEIKNVVKHQETQHLHQHAFNIQSDNSAFKPRETPLASADMLENLLCLLVNLYKGPTPVKSIQNDSDLSNVLLKPNYFDSSKLIKLASSPARFDQPSFGFTTPSIRKSVSIIQRADSESDLSGEKAKQNSGEPHGFQRYACHEEGKRAAPHDLSGFEMRTVKKMRSFSNEFTATKSLNFTDKENLSIGANSNMN